MKFVFTRNLLGDAFGKKFKSKNSVRLSDAAQNQFAPVRTVCPLGVRFQEHEISIHKNNNLKNK
jgi:hypothetical protein